MIDYIHLKGCLGALKEHHSLCFDRVTFATFNRETKNPATTYLTSPLTGAQIELKPIREFSPDGGRLHAEFKIPVAAALVGQNCIHAGISSVPLELGLLSTLVRLLLAEQGFTAAEITTFINSAYITMLELTWHVQTKNLSAARKRLRAVAEHLSALERANSRHDIFVREVDQWTSNGATTVLARAKSDCSMRMYLKSEQMGHASRQVKKGGFLAHEMRRHRNRLLSGIDGQLRVELLLGETFLRPYGLDRPRRLQTAPTIELKKLIFLALSKFRLAHLGEADYECFSQARANLSAENIQFLERYESGEDVLAKLSDYKGSRTRKALLGCGVDVALPKQFGLNPFQRTLSGQIAVENMVRYKQELAAFAVSEERAKQISLSLLRMLKHARDGIRPNDISLEARLEWLEKRELRLLRARAVHRYRKRSESSERDSYLNLKG
ncbi:hypothetical protein [Achromobacter xylosoxidans]|uniref:hypothetical protein n=1 Tax=Alcaligenes xylosoxydans xylosoxydans TaxID=85698 RepID=UPI0011B7A1A6|nr:hypothetical protein [Achromobacter xylosoxidans]